MFLQKYLDDFYFDLLFETYEEGFLDSLDEENFIKIYNLFKKYNFYFIDDIVLKHLELFLEDEKTLENKILNLKTKFGSKFVYILGNDMTYLDELY